VQAFVPWPAFPACQSSLVATDLSPRRFFERRSQSWLGLILTLKRRAKTFSFGFFTSLQYTSMNTLVYAGVTEEQTSGASTIASTMQQMAISFGVASASLATAFFIPDRFHSSAPEMIHGIHRAFLVLGALTVLSRSSSAA